MRTSAVVVGCVMIGLAVSPLATAHLQVGDNSTFICHSQPHPLDDGTDRVHTHQPGGADDQCKSLSELLQGALA